MAINRGLPKLTEEELNSPDIDDDGELNVERYSLPSSDGIEDPYLAEVWDAAVKSIEKGVAGDEVQIV